ncbi:MAG: hypothetical protein ACI86H_001838 [bacterium]|jgi:hypothetical protein
MSDKIIQFSSFHPLEFQESLSPEELELFQGAFHRILFFVSSADNYKSFLEDRAIKKAFQELEETYGEAVSHIWNLNSDIQSALFQETITMSQEVIEQKLNGISIVLQKLPNDFLENFKTFLLSQCLEVAKASREEFLTGARVSKEEQFMTKKIIQILEITPTTEQLQYL